MAALRKLIPAYRMVRQPTKAFVLMPTLLAATGCGQKGPLFLPGTPSDMRQVNPPSEPAGDEEDDDEDESSTGSGR